MAKADGEGYSIHFAHFAGKLERYIRNNGISCHDVDLIIEESSVLYFEKLHSSGSKISKLMMRHDPAQLFAESVTKAIERHLPGAKNTFGSFDEIEKCIK